MRRRPSARHARPSPILATLLVTFVVVTGCETEAPAPTPVPRTAVAIASAAPEPTAAQRCTVPGGADLHPSACAVIAKAKTEADLVISAGSFSGDLTTLGAAFGVYFGLRAGSISVRPATEAQVVAQIVSGAKQGTSTGYDVVSLSQRALAEIDEFVHPLDWKGVWGLRDADLVNNGHDVFGYTGLPARLIFNRDLVGVGDLPKTYLDLLGPRWRGRILMERSALPLEYVALAVNDIGATAVALRVARGLAGDPPGSGQARFASSASELLQRVAAGEFMLGLGADGGSTAAAVGVHLIEPVPLSLFGLAVLKEARSPNLAQLFCYWLGTTVSGQQQLEAVFGRARHTSPGSSTARALAGRTFIVPTAAFESKSATALGQIFDPILGIR